MKKLMMFASMVLLSSCCYAARYDSVPINPSRFEGYLPIINHWTTYTSLNGGFSVLGDKASIGSVGGVSLGAKNDKWEIGGSYHRADSSINDVDFTLHSITADLYRCFSLGLVEGKIGGSLGGGFPFLDGPRRGSDRVYMAYGGSLGYLITPNMSLGLSVRERVFNTTVLTTSKVIESEPLLIDGIPSGTVETETLVTTEDSQNLNALECGLQLIWRF